jgi:hypothetical protein
MGGVLTLGLNERSAGGNPDFRLDAGSVIRRVFRIWGACLGPFSLVGLVTFLPALLLIGVLAALGTATAIHLKFVEFLSNFLSLALTGAVTYGVFRHLHGEPASVGEILRVGMSRFGAVWTTSLLFGLCVLGGCLLLVIPGIVIAARYWVAVPVTVIESEGARASLERSRDLTENNRWRVFSVMIRLVLLMLVAAFVCGIAALVLARAWTYVHNPGLLLAFEQAVVLVLMIPIQVLVAIGPAVVYHDLRLGKEGGDVSELLKVFA